ncbi:MAG: hypothetical protein U0944_03815, partial [Candidatus Moranbacteria bacterium]|nr:hypothetical protein [Candidatus Moranbacteria bacterium]
MTRSRQHKPTAAVSLPAGKFFALFLLGGNGASSFKMDHYDFRAIIGPHRRTPSADARRSI